MKQWLLAILAVFVPLALFGQGTVHFGGDSSTPIVNGSSGLPLTAADGISAALYWAPLGSSNFTQLGAPVSVGVPLPGLFVGGTRTTGPATAGGDSARFQVRAWEAAYGATYEEAMSSASQGGRTVLAGQSAILEMPTGNAAPPTPPTLLTAHGLGSFRVTPATFPPNMVCPPDYSTAPAVFTYTLPVATGNPAPVVACLPPSGSALPIGTNIIICTASNPVGTNQCSFRVIVKDTEPPVINCPAGIKVEFTDGSGAPATFAPTASDAQGSVTVNCTPASGTVFPIGTNSVLCTATDASGNSASCTFTVSVPGSRGVVQDVLAELTSLTLQAQPQERGFVIRTIRRLNLSLAPALWVDETHLAINHGSQVFAEHDRAVQDLCQLFTAEGAAVHSGAGKALAGRIIKADRLLAWVQVQEAAKAGGRKGRIQAALRELASGDHWAASGDCAQVINHYRTAWLLARPISAAQ